VGTLKWSVHKHQLLGLALHHVAGKAEVVTTACRTLEFWSWRLQRRLRCNSSIRFCRQMFPTVASTVVHFCWDDFDLNEQTPSGGGTTHTTHGVVMQELENDAETEQHAEYQVPKSKIRSFKVDSEEPFPTLSKSKCTVCCERE